MSVLKLQCPICLKEQDVYPYINTYTCSTRELPNKHCVIWSSKSIESLEYLNIYLDDSLSIATDGNGNDRQCYLFKDGTEIERFYIDPILYWKLRPLILENTDNSKRKD